MQNHSIKIPSYNAFIQSFNQSKLDIASLQDVYSDSGQSRLKTRQLSESLNTGKEFLSRRRSSSPFRVVGSTTEKAPCCITEVHAKVMYQVTADCRSEGLEVTVDKNKVIELIQVSRCSTNKVSPNEGEILKEMHSSNQCRTSTTSCIWSDT